jgi:CheY-like chemotaxis protein
LIDPSQIDQILVNLIVNARDAIEGVGRIVIETKNVSIGKDNAHPKSMAAGEYNLLTISDNGSGMDEETLSHLFEPFFTTKELGKGTGLGLATIFGIIKQNNGNIYVTSKPEMGTTFKIYLPICEAEVIQPIKTQEEIMPQIGTETILVVEDEEALLQLTVDALEESGYTILAANTPADAIRLVQGHEHKVDLVITDVIMPKMNGKELVKRIRLLQPGIKCLFMSGYTADIIADEGVLDKDIFFIQKPFTLKSLMVIVQKALKSV